MFVIKEKTWIEDHYEVEDLYENIAYKNFKSASDRLIEISKKQDALFFDDYENSPLVVIRSCFEMEEEDLKYLKSEGNYWLTIQKLDVK